MAVGLIQPVSLWVHGLTLRLISMDLSAHRSQPLLDGTVAC
jgi:hypothetical protein